ncbi:hypothetical protein [Streptomyces sp. MBT55]|uniref:hypothetical protein n=1 Tax=Streptomyces sp. MBT55 TaxID=1488386 RepID=UPI001F175600|nr:hypothetical protein [Streptomyces sp. MBT55]
MGRGTEYCTAQARGEQSGGVRLELSLRPAAAHRAAGAAEEPSAAPIGFGCEGPLGKRPTTVDSTAWQKLPFARAKGTCRS